MSSHTTHYPARRVSHVQIFHNPSCSKSRAALEIVNRSGIDADVVKYLDTPPDREHLVNKINPRHQERRRRRGYFCNHADARVVQ